MSRIVLVVEDEKNLRALYKLDLEADGHTVVTAGNATEALEAVERVSPDIVVLDIRLPGVDGLDVMTRILDKHPRLPIVLNTAFPCYKDDFMSWAADAYVVKSSDTSELRAKIRELLGLPVECTVGETP